MGVIADPGKRKGNMHDVEILDRRQWSPHAYWFRLRLIDSPLGPADEPFTFAPGQWVYLIDSQGFKADQRAFSLATSPAELPEFELGIEIVPGGLFSPRIPTWKPGDRFTIRGPFGTFQLRDTIDSPWVGGAFNSGVVPLMSMLRDQLEVRRSEQPFVLFFAYSTEEHHLFREELQSLSDRHAGFVLRTCETGSIDPSAIPEVALDATLVHAFEIAPNARAYLAGLNGFIQRATEVLLAVGYPRDRIAAERYD